MKLPKNLKYHIITLGCQMNKSDSERIEGLLLDMGMKEAGRAEEADLIILNTCSVRQTAEDRVYGLIRNFNRLKRQKPHLLVAVTGCVAGRDKDGKIKAKMPGVDFFFPISDLPHLPELIFSQWLTIGFPEPYSYPQGKIDYLGVKPKAKERWRGSVVIQTGCSNYCTYCVVPYARGHEKNRSAAAILKEVREMVYPVKSAKGRASSKQFNRVKNGAREIQLLGQAVNGWQAPDPKNFSKENPLRTVGHSATYSDFAALLWEISQIPDVNRIGFASAHPMYMNDAAIEALKLPKMMNYLHLPVQSGNDDILRKMNRKYTVTDYLKIISKIKKARPGISLATDIIVGFPGETKKQFADTVSLYKKCDFDLSYPAMYSARTGTAAFKAFADDVPREEKRRRWLVIQKLMEKTALRKNKKFVGRAVEVLVDGCGIKNIPSYYSLIRANKRIDGYCWGFSREYKKVAFFAPRSPKGEVGSGNKNLIGQIVKVKIKKAKEWEIEGDIV